MDIIVYFFSAKTIAIALQGVFCSRIARSTGNGEQTLNAAYENDCSRMSGSHGGENGLRQENGAEIICLENTFLYFRSNGVVQSSNSKSTAEATDVNITKESEGFLQYKRWTKIIR